MLDGAEPLGAGIHGIAPWLQAPEGLQRPLDALVFGNSGLNDFYRNQCFARTLVSGIAERSGKSPFPEW